MLRKLSFRLNLPTPYVFMLRFLKAAQSDKKVNNDAFKYYPSSIIVIPPSIPIIHVYLCALPA